MEKELEEMKKELDGLFKNDLESFHLKKRDFIAQFIKLIGEADNFKITIRNINQAKHFFYLSDPLARAIFLDSLIRQLFPFYCQIYLGSNEKKQRWLLWAIKWMVKQSPDTFSWLRRLKYAEKYTEQTIIVPAFPLAKTAKLNPQNALNFSDFLKIKLTTSTNDYSYIFTDAEYCLKNSLIHRLFLGIKTEKEKRKILDERKKEWKLIKRFRNLQKYGVQDKKDFWVAIYLGEEAELKLAKKWHTQLEYRYRKPWINHGLAAQRLSLLRKKETKK